MCILFPVIDSCISCSPCKGRQPLFVPQCHNVLWPVQVPGIASLYLMHNLQDKECVQLCCCMIHTSDTMSSSLTAEAYQLCSRPHTAEALAHGHAAHSSGIWAQHMAQGSSLGSIKSTFPLYNSPMHGISYRLQSGCPTLL